MKLQNSSIIDTYLAYYGAYVDGEGHIGIKKEKPRKKGFNTTYTERVSVASTNEMIIRSFDDIVVGHIYKHKPTNLSKHQYWSWEVTNDKARTFLKIIIPYLKTKELQARIVLALGRNKEKTKRKRIPPEDLKLREDLYIVLRALHGN